LRNVMYKCVNVYDHLVRAGCVAVVVCSRLDSAVHFDIDIFAFFVYVIGSRQTVLCRCLFCYLCLSDVMMRQIVALLCCIHPPFYLNQFPARFLPCRSCAKVFFLHFIFTSKEQRILHGSVVHCRPFSYIFYSFFLVLAVAAYVVCAM